MSANPKRFAAFAALPTSDPKAAADELERAVTKLGFKGAMIHGLANGTFLDDKRFWPIYERAEALDVPIYLHPSMPTPAVIDAYYKDYAKDFPMVVRAAWGYTVETATQAIRLVLSRRVRRTIRSLKIILGHLGETLPFLVWRIDHALARPGAKTMQLPRHLLRPLLHHDQRQLLQSGADVLRAGDGHRPHPVRGRLAVRGQQPGVEWMKTVPLCDEDKAKISERQRPAAAADVAGSAGACAWCDCRSARHCLATGRVGVRAVRTSVGPVAQRLEPTAHNGLVGGSSPPGPTNEIRYFLQFLFA